MIFFIWREFGDGEKFDGEGNVFGHTYFPGVGIGGDMFFDPDEHWLLYPYNDEGSNQFEEKSSYKVQYQVYSMKYFLSFRWFEFETSSNTWGM